MTGSALPNIATEEGTACSSPSLPLTRYRLLFWAEAPLVLPGFQGAFWRSLLGRELHDAHPALYRQLIETPRSPKGGARVPHPYLFPVSITPSPLLIAAGDTFAVDLTLIGHGNAHADTLFAALARCAERGLGQTRGTASLVEVLQEEETPAPPPCPERVHIALPTPLQLVRTTAEGRRRPVRRPKEFQAADLMLSLLRRLQTLMHFHGDAGPVRDFPVLKALAAKARAQDPRLRFFNLHRWSARQRRKIPMGGLVGHFTLDLDEITPLWPWLWLGQFVHTGKGTVMGLGALELSPASPLQTERRKQP